MKEQITDIVKEHQIELIKGLVTSVFIARVDKLIATEVERRIKERLGSEESIKYLLLDTALKCPHCGGEGWYVVPSHETGEPEQEQCRWCWELEHFRSRLTENKQEGGEG